MHMEWSPHIWELPPARCPLVRSYRRHRPKGMAWECLREMEHANRIRQTTEEYREKLREAEAQAEGVL